MTPEKLTKIKSLCSRHTEIVAAYLFGSTVKSPDRPAKDVDLAVLLEEPESSPFPLLSFMAKLEKKCGTRADVVVLNRAGEFLKHEIRRTGKLIFERNPTARKRFEVIGRKRFEDFLYLHHRYTGRSLYGGRYG